MDKRKAAQFHNLRVALLHECLDERRISPTQLRARSRPNPLCRNDGRGRPPAAISREPKRKNSRTCVHRICTRSSSNYLIFINSLANPSWDRLTPPTCSVLIGACHAVPQIYTPHQFRTRNRHRRPVEGPCYGTGPRNRNRLIRSRSSHAEGRAAEGSPCLQIRPAEGRAPGTRACSSVKRSHSSQSTSGPFESG